jgi:hypothetical protein
VATNHSPVLPTDEQTEVVDALGEPGNSLTIFLAAPVASGESCAGNRYQCDDPRDNELRATSRFGIGTTGHPVPITVGIYRQPISW